jgi:hypothetical protein
VGLGLSGRMLYTRLKEQTAKLKIKVSFSHHEVEFKQAMQVKVAKVYF